MKDIEYTNIMLEFEKLSRRMDSLEEILGEYVSSGYAPAIRNKSIGAEEFSRFWNETEFNNFKGEKS